MATKTFNTRIANKRDTSANWTSNNPVLLNGEIIIVDTEAGQVRYKVGNGTSTYTQLPFTDESLIANINGKLSLSGGTMTGNINMGSHKLTGLGAPVDSNDAVRQADLKVVSDEVDGIIAGTTAITLPIADDTKLGGVKIGEGVNVAEDGTISVTPELPTGGTAGQVLTKTADGSAWEDAPSGLPEGGTEGQMLYKAADGAAWGDNPIIYVNITGNNSSGYTANKTLSEIKDAYQKGFFIIANTPNGIIPMTDIYENNANFIEFDMARKQTNEYLVKEDRVIFQMTAMSNFASDVSYNNEASGLRAINVQDAIDEVQENVENVLPSGGTTGQVLTKTSTGEEWSDAPSGLPESGTEGQILEKTSSGAAWVDKPESGLTQEQADERYLQLSGGEVNGEVTVNDWLYVKSGAISVNPSPLMNTAGINSDEIATNKIYRRGSAGYPNLSFSSSNIRLYNNKGNGASVSVGPTGDLNGSQVKISGDYVYISNLVDPTDPDDATNKQYVDSKSPTSVAVTLTSSGWSSNTQTVTVSGVSATETAQLITPTPAIASQSAYYEAGIMCTGQAANSLTFTCQTVPTSNLTVYVVIQPLS